MSEKIFFHALFKFLAGVILTSLLLFVPAGTFRFPNGWKLMGVLFIPMFIAGMVLLFKNPGLLLKRLKAKEEGKDQDILIKISGIMFAAGFILAGLDFRFGWSVIPNYVSNIGAILFLSSYMVYAEVLRENAYLSRTIEVEKNQKIIDKGLYGIVRHPMYSSTIVLFLSMPLVLGSIYSFFVFLIYPFILVKRIYGEEELLEKELSGYKEYTERVKYRLLPYVW